MADGDNDEATFTAADLALVGDEPGHRKSELLALMHTSPEEYSSPDVQNELVALVSGTAPARVQRSDADLALDDTVPASWTAYGIPDHPSGEARSELDNRLITGALQRFHQAGFTHAQATAAIEALDAAEVEAERLLAQRAETKVAENAAAVRQAFGDHYHQETQAANAFIKETFTPLFPGGVAQALMKTVLPDGSRLGDSPGFVKWAAQMARPTPGGAAAPSGEGGAAAAYVPAGFEALAERKRAILALMHSDEAAYTRAQPELQRIIAAMNAQAG